MRYIKIGKIVNTHALKGEVRIISDFEYKDRVFKENNKIYIGKDREEKKISSYRKHKNFEMLMFEGINDISEVIKYKGVNVYCAEDDLKLNDDQLLTEDLIDMKVYNNDIEIGKVSEYRNYNGNKILKVNEKYIPFNKDFIFAIDKMGKKIYYKDIDVFL